MALVSSSLYFILLFWEKAIIKSEQSKREGVAERLQF